MVVWIFLSKMCITSKPVFTKVFLEDVILMSKNITMLYVDYIYFVM